MAIPSPSEHQDPSTRQTLFATVIMLGAMLLLSGCWNNSAPAEPEMYDTLPSDWIVVTNDNVTWHPVNIDDDAQDEFVLFYTYNNQEKENPSGPTGASILDLQNNSELVPQTRIISMPYQPSGSYVPYRILPNYWKEYDTGFIAPAGRHASVTVSTIDRSQQREVLVSEPTPESGDATPEVETKMVPIQELLIEDGGYTITVAWWRNLVAGYGVANAHAAAGIKDKKYEKDDNAATPLQSFNGRHPFNDRSELCHVMHYEREYLPQSEEMNSGKMEDQLAMDIRFKESPLGIQFCKDPPEAPFYPEAVVLKYLFVPSSEEQLLALDKVNKTEVADPLTEAFSAGKGNMRIEGLYGPSLIPFDNVDGSPATVCASFVDNSPDRVTAYRFRLIHIMADVEKGTTDQFKIVNVQQIPAPPNGPPVNCNDIVENGTPGRVPIP